MDKTPESTMDDLRERIEVRLRAGLPPVGWSFEHFADAILEEIRTTHVIIPKRGIPEHGTIYMYTRKRCRCAECKAANAEYSREYRTKKGAIGG